MQKEKLVAGCEIPTIPIVNLAQGRLYFDLTYLRFLKIVNAYKFTLNIRITEVTANFGKLGNFLSVQYQ